jgi:hypothetical protein
MNAMGGLAAIGTGGVGRTYGRHEDEPWLLDDQGLKRETVIGWQHMRTEIV